jgi:aminoglycoside 3-N-acetyltransferase
MRTISLNEKDALRPILEHMRVPSDGILVVHSAIAPLSRRGFRAEAMIECLLDHLSDGTLIMPTMTWRTVTPRHPFWDEIQTPSHTGVLTEVFRTKYATARSIHPTHSVAACGRNATTLLARHHLADNPVSANSPYGLMRNHTAFILMVGVGLESCTAIHLAEEAVAPDVYLQPEVENYQCRDRNGTVHRVGTRRHRRLNRDFPKFAALLEKQDGMRSGEVEGCPYQIVSLTALLDQVFSALGQNERATLAV